MGIYLRGGEAAVAEDLLDGVQVSAVVQHMRREGVTYNVGAPLVNCRYHSQVFTDNSIDRFRVKSLTVSGNKYIIILDIRGEFFLIISEVHC